MNVDIPKHLKIAVLDSLIKKLDLQEKDDLVKLQKKKREEPKKPEAEETVED